MGSQELELWVLSFPECLGQHWYQKVPDCTGGKAARFDQNPCVCFGGVPQSDQGHLEDHVGPRGRLEASMTIPPWQR